MTRWIGMVSTLLFAAAATLAAQEVSLRAEAQPTAGVTVGDPIAFTLTAEYPSDWTVSFPGLGQQLGDFRVRDVQLHPPAGEGGRRRQQMTAVLAAFRTGRMEIPAVSAVFTGPQGEGREESTGAVPVEVLSVLEEESPELKDLKPQAEIAESHLWLWIGLLILLAAAAAAWAIRRRLARRVGDRAQAAPETPPLPPHEEAQRALEALLARKLMVSGEMKLFYFELAEIIRRMVGRQYGIVTLERTTWEILAALRDVPHQPLAAASLEDFLSRCDLIKFARHEPQPIEQQDLLRAARGLIDDVRQSYEAARRPIESPPRRPADDTRPGASTP